MEIISINVIQKFSKGSAAIFYFEIKLLGTLFPVFTEEKKPCIQRAFEGFISH